MRSGSRLFRSLNKLFSGKSLLCDFSLKADFVLNEIIASFTSVVYSFTFYVYCFKYERSFNVLLNGTLKSFEELQPLLVEVAR